MTNWTEKSRHLVLTALAVLAGSCGGRPPHDWVARLGELSGTVEFANPGDRMGAAKLGVYLRVNSELQTGPDSKAILDLRNGGHLTVAANSLVKFTSDAPERQLNVGLQSGALTGSASQVEASELVITVGGRKVRLASRASAEVNAAAKPEEATIKVIFGTAVVEGPGGETRKVIELSKTLSLSFSAKPDAAVTKPTSRPTIEAGPLVFWVQATGKGRVSIRRPGERRWVVMRKGEPLMIRPGTHVQLAKGASIVVGTEKGHGTTVIGPAELEVLEGDPGADGKGTLKLESAGTNMQLSSGGVAGTTAAGFEAEGVKVTPRVVYKRLEMRTRRERGRTTLSMLAGEAELETKDHKKLTIEAGQEASLQKGIFIGPHMPQPAPMEIKSGGGTRIFTASASIPVTFHWTPGEGGALVEIGKSAAMDHPLFSDIIKRRVLTVPQLTRGTHFWRVRPVDKDGRISDKVVQGKLFLVKDTSYRSLKDQKANKNVIDESFGNTTVFYQNVLPRFTFRWHAVENAVRYQMKIFREQQLNKPIFIGDAPRNDLSVPAGKLGEGSYIWFVVAMRGNELLRTSSSRKLSIRYDNATPDLQIVYPPNGITVGNATLETNGVTIPGSSVSINGVRAELDETYRFTHTVKLKQGLNTVIYQVSDRRRGVSYYLRQITRQ